MGKIIDADLINRSKELTKKIVTHNLIPYLKVDDLLDFIDSLPIAFDAEKVVAELQEKQRKDTEDAEFYRNSQNEKLCIAHTSRARAFTDAIEIVSNNIINQLN